MSNPSERAAEDAYEAQNDDYAGDRVRGDSSYVSDDQRKMGGPQVVRDEDADLGADAAPGSVTNSDAQLGKYSLEADGGADTARRGLMNHATVAERDEKEAIDTRNILPGAEKGIQTRGVKKDYKEPGEEEGLPGRGDSGSSSLRTAV
jgi:hypothetical protein